MCVCVYVCTRQHTTQSKCQSIGGQAIAVALVAG